MPIDQATLNAQTAEAAAFLARFLAQHIEGMTIDREEDGSVTILLHNLYQDDRPIKLETRNAEITLEFGECHCHFTSHDGMTEEWLVGDMIKKVAAIVGGQEHSYSAHAGELCLGGGWLNAVEAAGRLIESFPEATHFRVAAWAPWDDLRVTRPQFYSRLTPAPQADNHPG